MNHVARLATAAGVLVLIVSETRPGAQQDAQQNTVCDISGEWSAQFNEDWEERVWLGANLGD
jgi:hypothetical protein